jgi:hypothetical protein
MIPLDRGAIGGPAVDFKDIFGPRHRGELVVRHTHDEPTPRVPDYDEIARLVSSPVQQREQSEPVNRPDPDDGQRGAPVSTR